MEKEFEKKIKPSPLDVLKVSYKIAQAALMSPKQVSTAQANTPISEQASSVSKANVIKGGAETKLEPLETTQFTTAACLDESKDVSKDQPSVIVPSDVTPVKTADDVDMSNRMELANGDNARHIQAVNTLCLEKNIPLPNRVFSILQRLQTIYSDKQLKAATFIERNIARAIQENQLPLIEQDLSAAFDASYKQERDELIENKEVTEEMIATCKERRTWYLSGAILHKINFFGHAAFRLYDVTDIDLAMGASFRDLDSSNEDKPVDTVSNQS